MGAGRKNALAAAALGAVGVAAFWAFQGMSTSQDAPGTALSTTAPEIPGRGAPVDADQATGTPGGELPRQQSVVDAAPSTDDPVTGAGRAEPRPEVAADVAPERVAEQAPADDIVVPVIAEQNRALGQPEAVDWDSVVSVAAGPLLESIEVAVLEYSELGWTQVGAPRLVSSTVLDLVEEPPPTTARIEVCLDFDRVDVVDSTGASLVDQTAETRVRSVLTVVYMDGRWVATAQEFTDELSC